MIRGLLTVGLLALAGCGGIGFDTSLKSDGEIPGLLTAPGFTDLNASGSLASLTANNTEASHISSAKVTGGTLAVTNPTVAQDNLKYISSFDVQVSAPNLATVTIATIPSSAFTSAPQSVSVTGADVELKPYVQSGSISMTPNVTFGSRPQSPIDVQLSLTVHIDVTP